MKIVLTGSSTGIGKALAEHFLAKGHEVAGLARSEQSAQGTPHAGHFHPFRCDVSKWDDVARVASEIRLNWGTIDALIACAGLQGEIGPALTADPARWSATVRANLDGTYHALRAFFDLFHAGNGKRAKLVCFSGGGATKARANFSAYGVAKTGVVRLVETIAEECRDLPVDINAIAPGAINTRLTDEVLALGPAVVGQDEYDSAMKQKAKGGASLEKAIGLVEYLLSAESDGVTGRLIAAPWDPWPTLGAHAESLKGTDVYMLRRIVPEERGLNL